MKKHIKFLSKDQKAFTLVELLVAIGIIMTSATVVVAVITSSFRTSTKIGISEDVRQSGDSALSQVSKMIQFADSFKGMVDGTGNPVTTCTTSPAVTYSKIKIGVDGVEKIISCVDSDGNFDLNLESGSDSVPFINSGRVKVVSCTMTCVQQRPIDTPVIGIKLDLSQENGSVAESQSSLHLIRSVKMRNLSSD